MRPRGTSLAALVAFTLVFVMTIVLGTYSYLAYRRDAAGQRDRLEKLTNVQVDEAAVALEMPVWNIDREQIDRVLKAMARPLSLYSIRVTFAGETRGYIRNAKWELVSWDGGGPDPAGAMLRDKDVQHGDKRIGTVHLAMSDRFLERDLRQARVAIITPIIVTDLILIVCIYFILWQTVVRPLQSIQRFAAAVSAGGHDPAPPAIGSAAELVSLRLSLETTIRLLDQRFAELQEEMVLRFESEQRFHTIFDSVKDAIIIYDPESGAILDVNHGFTDMLGYSHEEATKLYSGAFASGLGQYRPDVAVERIRALGPDDHFLAEWQIRRKDGQLLWVEVSVRPAVIGGMRRVISVARDLTQRKEMEEQLRRAETMSAMGSLVAGVAHEVRNPLFGISATIDAFEAEFGGRDGAAEYMSTLRNDLTRLSRLMTDLLEYGRPQPMQRQMQSIGPLIAEAMRVCLPRAREKGVEVTQLVRGPLGQVAIDSDRMLQVLKNVVENAIDHSRSGDTVELSVRADGERSPTLLFTVVDHGPGFRAEDLPHVFTPFFTRRKGGSGLGLAIAQKIVTEHGGTIEASNGVGGGGRIEIRLPA